MSTDKMCAPEYTKITHTKCTGAPKHHAWTLDTSHTKSYVADVLYSVRR